MCFKALVVRTNQIKAQKMLEGEAGQRLKAFLAGKLASTLRKCYMAIIKNHDNIAAENMKNNENAKKVALILEKIARGIVHRCFSAFVRYHALAAEERAAEAALAARLGALDEANKAKLRIFLDAKRLGKMSSFFKHWSNVAQNAALLELYEMLESEEAKRKAAEEELERLQAAAGDQGDAAAQAQAEVDALNQKCKQAEGQFRSLHSELKSLQRKIKDAEETLADEKMMRSEGREKLAVLRSELNKITAERDEMAGELQGIAGEVGGVHNETKFD